MGVRSGGNKVRAYTYSAVINVYYVLNTIYKTRMTVLKPFQLQPLRNLRTYFGGNSLSKRILPCRSQRCTSSSCTASTEHYTTRRMSACAESV